MHTNIKPRILGSAHCFEHKQMAQEGREMRKVHQIVDGFFFLLWFHQKQMKINIHDFRWFVSDSTKLGPLLITFSASNYPDFIHQHSFLDATLISHIIRKRKILFFIVANSFPSYEFAQGKTNKFHSIAVENVQQWMRVVRWIRCNIKTETVDTLRANYWSTSSFCDC